MSDFDKPSELIIELAKAVVTEMSASFREWEEAFVRMQADDGFFEAKCSCVLSDGPQILDVLAHKSFISKVQELGLALRQALPSADERFYVALLRVGSDMSYEMQYEYKDHGRWRISKMNGGTGMPVGYAPA
jgi:hypothetical protein